MVVRRQGSSMVALVEYLLSGCTRSFCRPIPFAQRRVGCVCADEFRQLLVYMRIACNCSHHSSVICTIPSNSTAVCDDSVIHGQVLRGAGRALQRRICRTPPSTLADSRRSRVVRDQAAVAVQNCRGILVCMLEYV